MKPEDVLKSVKWLIGTWKSITATANYPTMACPVDYCEILSFSAFGEPLLKYNSVTWLPDKHKYMHVEGGHLRVAEDGCTVCLLSSHNFGICSVEDGTVKGNSMELIASSISNSIFCKKKVCGLTRCYTLNDKGQLQYKLMMQTDTQSLTEHLKAVYEKEC